MVQGRMTKLDQVIERIRQLPQERQDEIADYLEYWLAEEEAGRPQLSYNKRAELRP